MPGDKPSLRIETLSTFLSVGGEGFYRLFVDGKEYSGLTPKPIWTIEQDPAYPWRKVGAGSADVGLLRPGPTENSVWFASKKPRPKVPSFFLKVKYKLSETSVKVRFTVDWPETYPYLSNEVLSWITPAGERAAQVMLAVMDNIPGFLRDAIGRIKIVRVPTPPASGNELANFNSWRSTGSAVVVYNKTVAMLNGLTQTPDYADRLLAYVFLHEFAHAIMSRRCGDPWEQWWREWLTMANGWARWASSTVIGLPLGVIAAIPPVLAGPFFSEHDFMTDWSKATGWVINDGQGIPLLGFLLWDKFTKPPNWGAAHKDAGKAAGLRNLRMTAEERAALDAAIAKHERLNEEYNRLVQAYNDAVKAYNDGVAAGLPPDQLSLLDQKITRAEAPLKRRKKELDDLAADIEKRSTRAGFISGYSTTNPHEDWAESISRPLTGVPPRPLKDPARIKFLKGCRLLPPNKPIDISHWLGFTVVWKLGQPRDPATKKKGAPVAKKKPRGEVSAAEFARAFESAAEPDIPGEKEEKSPVAELVKSFHEGPLAAAIKANREAFAQVAAGMSENAAIDLLRNAELHGEGWRAYGGAGHETRVGDLVVGADCNPWAVAATDARGNITQMLGDMPLTDKTREKDLLISRDSIAIHWRPSAKPRTWSPAAAPSSSAWKDLDAAMKRLIGLWGRETSEVSKRDVSTGSGFFLELLDLAGAADPAHSLTDSSSFERVLGFCAAHGAGVLPGKRAETKLKPGDVVLSSKRRAVAVVTRESSEDGRVDLLAGGIQKTGPVGESEFEVKLLHGAGAGDFDFVWVPSGAPLPLDAALAAFYGAPSALQRLAAKVGGAEQTEDRRAGGERLTFYYNEPYDVARLLADGAPKALRDKIWQGETFQQLREIMGELPGGLKPYTAGQPLPRGAWLLLAPNRFGVVMSTTADGVPATMLTHGEFALAIEPVVAGAVRWSWIPSI